MLPPRWAKRAERFDPVAGEGDGKGPREGKRWRKELPEAPPEEKVQRYAGVWKGVEGNAISRKGPSFLLRLDRKVGPD